MDLKESVIAADITIEGKIVGSGHVRIAGRFKGETAKAKEKDLACRSLVIVGMRKPRDELYHALLARESELKDAGIASVARIGDSLAPGAIVHAVHGGHRYAREFDSENAEPPYTRDFPV